MQPKAVSKAPTPGGRRRTKNEEIRALMARVEGLGEREGQHETDRLWREAEQAARAATNLDRLIGAFASMQHQLEESRCRVSATLDVQSGGAAVHPLGGGGGRPADPAELATEFERHKARRQDPVPMAVSD